MEQQAPAPFDFSARKPFPTVFDNTMRAEFVSCPRAFFYRFQHGCDLATPSVHLHAGASFAKGLEVARKRFYDEGNSADVAVAHSLAALYTAYGDFDPGDSAKSADGIAGALEYYFSVFPLDTDRAKPTRTATGRSAVEFNFVLPIPEVCHPETGEPMLYSGRFDMLADWNGAIYVEDDKTTGSLGASWAKQWELRSQFTGYVWGAQQFGYDVRGALIRGIAILKRGYNHAEAVVYRPQWMIDQWYAQLVRDLHRAIDMWREGYWDANFADSCASYGSCQYLQLCTTPDPSQWANGSGRYAMRFWNPADPWAESLETAP